MPRAFRGFNSGFIKASDRVVSPPAFMASSTQPAVTETITVKKIDGTLVILNVNVIEVSTGLTQGAPNTCDIEVGPPGNGSKTFSNRNFA